MYGDRGFIALISILVISAVLLVLLFTLETASFFTRFGALEAENKRESLSLAEACVSVARLQFARGDYAQKSVQVDVSDTTKVCKICEITAAGSIKIRAVYKGTYTNLVIAIDPHAPESLRSWSEVPNYVGPACTIP